MNERMGVWELPKEWGVVKLGELVEMKSGFACAKKNLVAKGVPHLRPFNIGTNGELDFTEVYQIPEDFKSDVDTYALEPGHVLFNNTNSVELVGKTAIVREPLRCAFSNHLTRLTILNKERLEPQWLALALRQLWADSFFAANCNKWIGQAGFNTNMLATVDIPIPYPHTPSRSLVEQRRIVARIEELFDRLNEARRLRLVADEDVDRLLSAVLDEIFDRSNTKNWQHLTINDLIIGKPQYGTSSKAIEKPVGIPVLRMGNIGDGQISFEKLKYIDLPPKEEPKFLLKEGDILFNRTNSAELVGKSAVYTSQHRAVFASYLIRIVADPNKANPHFIVTYINSPSGRKYIQSQLTRAIGQVNVNAKKLQAMPIPTPSLTEQELLVEYIQEVQAKVVELKRQQAASSAELQRLEGLILTQAFRGEL